MTSDGKWEIIIKSPFEGLAPAYYANSYPSYGRRTQAGALQNVNLTDPTILTQGPGLSNLTNGTQAGALSTLPLHILNFPSTSDVTWGIGGNKLYKISSSAIISDANYPHTIDKAAVTGEDGRSVIHYNGFVYYFYNHSGSAGDIGRLTTSTDTFDDDWGSTVPTGAATLQNAEHPAILGGDGIIYFGNGRYVGYYDPATNTLSADELDLPIDTDVVDLVYEKGFVFIATNSPNTSGNNTNQGIIYTWDTTSSSFQEPIIEVPGKLGAMIVKNGTIFVFYQDLSSTGGFKLGYISGDTVQEVASFSSSLPVFGQVCHYKNHILFSSGGLLFTWGAQDSKTPVALTQIADGGHATVGALANPFGTPMVASNDGGTNYRLAKFSGYETACNWKSLMFDVATSVVDKVKVHFEPTASGASCALQMTYNRGVPSALSLGTISHTNESGKIHKTFTPSQEVDDFRIEFDWSAGSATNPISIRKIEIIGHLVMKE